MAIDQQKGIDEWPVTSCTRCPSQFLSRCLPTDARPLPFTECGPKDDESNVSDDWLPWPGGLLVNCQLGRSCKLLAKLTFEEFDLRKGLDTLEGNTLYSDDAHPTRATLDLFWLPFWCWFIIRVES